MSIFVKPVAAPKPRTAESRKIATAYAVILVILAVAQLFTFDTFLDLLVTFEFAGGRQMAYFLASLLVVSEVFALPFLLRMAVSPLFRWVSMGFALLSPLIWVKITTWLVIMDVAVTNVGFLGTVVEVMPGWWAVFVSAALTILAAWTAWGLWPGKRRK